MASIILTRNESDSKHSFWLRSSATHSPPPFTILLLRVSLCNKLWKNSPFRSSCLTHSDLLAKSTYKNQNISNLCSMDRFRIVNADIDLGSGSISSIILLHTLGDGRFSILLHAAHLSRKYCRSEWRNEHIQRDTPNW